MPLVVKSFSSQNEQYPAKNLQKPDSSEPWKLEQNEKEGWVEFEIRPPQKIVQVEVKNCGSELIEVSAGKNDMDLDDYMVENSKQRTSNDQSNSHCVITH